jgi:riboflavin kinase/FMN adenylyltransferase
MQIVTTDSEVSARQRGAVMALGNFDGVHGGHQRVIAEAGTVARTRNLALAATVFEPHPRQFFRPDSPPFRLQSPGQRARALEALGVDILFELKFDAALAAMTDTEFVQKILAERLAVAHVVVGADFIFGKNRMGDTAALTRLAAARGITVSAVPVLGGAQKVSSSAIRTALTDGRMEDAAALLTRPWAIEGIVLPGAALGRTIGFPTANLALGAYQRPAFGVYAVTIDIGDGARRLGVANIGVKPSVAAGAEPLLEVHLFDYADDLYGRRIEAALVKFIRPEQKFASFDALKAQIAADALTARTIIESGA